MKGHKHNKMRSLTRNSAVQIIAAFIIISILSACGTAATPEPTLDMNEYATRAVETIEANATATALSVPTNTPEPTYTPVSLPTDTPESIAVLPTTPVDSGLMIINPGNDPAAEAGPGVPENNILPVLPADSSAVLPVITQPTATTPPLAGDKASYDSQTPLDNSHVERGAEFDISWYLLNTGTTTWTTDYSLRYFTGTNFTKPGKNRWNLVQPVPPNTIGTCTVDAIAPEEPGTYKMSVVLGNENDENFFIVDLTIVVD